MADAVSTEAGRIDTPTVPSTPEVSGSLTKPEAGIERFISALNHSYNEYRAAHSVDPWETADRRGMDEDWARTYARGQGGYYFTLDTNGIKHAQYLQMHGMMSWLESKIQDTSLPPKAQKEFQRDFDILKKYTRKASDIDRRRARSGEQFSSLRNDRVHRELERIKENPELTTGNPEEDLRIAEYRVDNVITQLVGPRIRRNTLPQPTGKIPPAADTRSMEDLAGITSTTETPKPVNIPEGVERIMAELVRQGLSDEEITQRFQDEGIDLEDVIRKANAPASPPSPETTAREEERPEPEVVEPSEQEKKDLWDEEFRQAISDADRRASDVRVAKDRADSAERTAKDDAARVAALAQAAIEPEPEPEQEPETEAPAPGSPVVSLTGPDAIPSPAPVEALPADGPPPPAEAIPAMAPAAPELTPSPAEPAEPEPAPAPPIDTLASTAPAPTPEPTILSRRERLNARARATLDRLDLAIERVRTTTAYPFLPTDNVLVKTFKDVQRTVEGAVIKPTSILFLNTARLATKTVSKVIDPFAPKPAKPLPEYQPTTPTIINPKRTFIIANQSSDLSSPQELQVSEFINQEMRKGFWNWPKKIGLNWLEALAKKRVADQIRAASIKSGNPYVAIAMDQSKLKLRDLFLTRDLLWKKRALPHLKLDADSKRDTATSASAAILKQLQTEVGAGQELVQVQGELRQMLLDKIIHPLIKGEITDPLKVQELLREFVIKKQNDPQVQAIFGRNADRYGRLAEYFATNLIELTSEMKREINAGGTSLAVLDNEIDLRFARVRGRDQTERNLSITDKLIERAEGNRITGFVANPAVVSIASALALRFALKPTTRGAGASIVPIAGGILAGSIWGAVEGGYKVKVDRTTRQSGRTFMKNGEALRPPILRSNRPLERARYKAALLLYNRQASIEKGFETTDYERVPARDIQTKLRNLLDAGDKSDPRIREEIIDTIAEIRARLDFYDLNGIHKISYDSEDVVHQQNLDLVELRAEARTALRNEGLSDDQIITAERDAYGRHNQRFIENTEQQDRAFAAFRLKEMAIRGGIGAGIGGTFASATVFAADFVENVSGFNPLREFNRAVLNTFGGVSSEIASFVPRLRDAFSHGGTVNVTDHLQAVVNADSHGVRFINPTGETILRGQILPDGKISTTQDISALRPELEKSFDVVTGPVTPDTIIDTHTRQVPSHALGRTFQIPDGTTWEKGPDGKLDLVLKDGGKPLLEDVSFDKNGHIHFDKDSLLAKGVTEGHGERVVREMFGKNGEWTGNRTPIDHREWYSYDKPHSQGNELRLYDGIYENKQGHRFVVLNMSNMHLGYQTGLHPNPIDVQDVIKNHKSGFAFSMYVNGHSQTIWVPDGADGRWDGKLHLNPFDNNPRHFVETPQGRVQLGEFSRWVLNEKVMNGLPIGNTATELYHHRDLFNLRHGGKDGFIEAGRLVKGKNGNTLQAFATILGSGNSSNQITTHIPVIEINPKDITMEPKPPIILIPRDIEAPPIPIVYAPRFPLGPIFYQEAPIYVTRFKNGERLGDIFRRSGSSDRDPSKPDKEEARRSTETTKRAFDEADHIYIVFGGAIGDGVIGTAYLSGVQEALRRQGRTTQITLVVSQDHGKLYDYLASSNVNVEKASRGGGMSKAQQLIVASNPQKPLILEFEHFYDKDPQVETVTNGTQQITEVTNLLPIAVQLYNNDADGIRRYSHFVEELFSLRKNSLGSKVKPIINLPADKDAIYSRIASKFGIDVSNPDQITIVIEASVSGKRYNIRKYAKLISEISQEYPGYQFNILYNSSASPASGGYQITDIENALDNAGVRNICHIIDGSDNTTITDVSDIAVLLERQKLVIGNDTGIGHMAGAIESGPSVLTLFMPGRFLPKHWLSSTKQQAVTPSASASAGIPATVPSYSDHEKDEDKKYINKIEPEDIMQKVRTVL